MNTAMILLQLNAAMDWIKTVDATARQLPDRYHRQIGGLNHAGDVLLRLEIAKRELQDASPDEGGR